MTRVIDLAGQKFGILEVIERLPNDENGAAMWRCICSCGKFHKAATWNLRSGNTKSCGCLSRKRFVEESTKHGHAKKGLESKSYNTWLSMKQRCLNPNNPDYENYGGRGIQVCERWLNSFENFLEDMGERPKDRTLDRIDNNDGYYKENCKWSSREEQSGNRRSNHLITYQGKTQILRDWAKEYDLKFETLYMRIKNGWSIEEALTTPVKQNRKRSA